MLRSASVPRRGLQHSPAHMALSAVRLPDQHHSNASATRVSCRSQPADLSVLAAARQATHVGAVAVVERPESRLSSDLSSDLPQRPSAPEDPGANATEVASCSASQQEVALRDSTVSEQAELDSASRQRPSATADLLGLADHPVDTSIPDRSTDTAPQQPLSAVSSDLSQEVSSARGATHSLSTRTMHPVAAYISQLWIRDFALVEEQQVDLQPGLNVITGESGAGKSVLMSAVAQMLGAPAPTGCVRAPAELAVIEGTIHLESSQAKEAMGQLLEQVGLPARVTAPVTGPSGRLVLKRELYSQGADGGVRSRCFINSAATSLRVLREVGEALVDVNGQHAAQNLRDAGMQVQLLDRIAGTTGLASYFGKLLRKLQGVRADLTAFEQYRTQTQRDAMQKLVDQVRAVGVQAGEEVTLLNQLRAMNARRASMERCSLVHAAIEGDGSSSMGVLEGLRDLEVQLSTIQSTEEAHAGPGSEADMQEGSSSAEHACRLMEAALLKLQDARAAVSAAEAQVAEYARQFSFSQMDYDEASRRRQLLVRLCKKHQCSSTEELLERAAQAEAGLDKWFEMEGQTAEQQALVGELQQKLAEAGVQLGARRRAAAGKLRTAVESCLADLAMAGSRFDVRISWQAAAQASEGIAIPQRVAETLFESSPTHAFYPTPSGFDSVEFLLAAGPAEPLRPLASVASGGESSRIMLALKAAPAAALSEPASTSYAESAPASPPLAAGDAATPSPSKAAASEAGMLTLNGVIHSLSASNGEFDFPAQGEQDVVGSVEGMGAQVLILDELDSGVGGRLGAAVGQLLRSMVDRAGAPASASQILCVSHLPQVAAHAQHHLAVRKGLSAEGRVLTEFVPLLSSAERECEVAAMLGMGLTEAQSLMEASHSSHH